MESSGITIKGRDLPGAVKVIPEGLSEMISLRESHEFKLKETSSSSMSSNSSMLRSSSNNTSSSFAQSSNRPAAAPVRPEDTLRFNQALSSMSSGTYRSFGTSETTTSMSSSSKTETHGLTICQENLKSTLQSAISDLEVDLGRESLEDNSSELPELAPLSLSKDDNNVASDVATVESELLNSISSSLVNNEGHSPKISGVSRRDPRLMYTDSSFYNPKHHPSVAEQVQMAHRLSCSLYEPGNRSSTGQDMFLKRALHSENWSTTSEEVIGNGEGNGRAPGTTHDAVPNLKLVMNPEGRTWELADMGPEVLPPPNPLTPEIAQSVVQNLENTSSRGGELFAKRRRKAADWVVDEENLGKNNANIGVADSSNIGLSEPSMAESSSVSVEADQRKARMEAFADETRMKADQGMEMRRAMEESLSNREMPILSTGTSNPYMQNMNWSIHNAQGIDVWTSPAPKSWTSFAEKAQSYNSHLVQDLQLKKGALHKAEAPLGGIPMEPKASQGSLPPKPSPVINADLQKAQMSSSAEGMSSGSKSISSSSKVESQSIKKQAVERKVLQPGPMEKPLSKGMSASEPLGPPPSAASLTDLERSKREEYESWFKTQEALQEKMEYDCLVKYSEDHMRAGEDLKGSNGAGAVELSAMNPGFLSQAPSSQGPLLSKEIISSSSASHASAASSKVTFSSQQSITDDQLNKIYKEVCLDKQTPGLSLLGDEITGKTPFGPLVPLSEPPMEQSLHRQTKEESSSSMITSSLQAQNNGYPSYAQGSVFAADPPSLSLSLNANPPSQFPEQTPIQSRQSQPSLDQHQTELGNQSMSSLASQMQSNSFMTSSEQPSFQPEPHQQLASNQQSESVEQQAMSSLASQMQSNSFMTSDQGSSYQQPAAFEKQEVLSKAFQSGSEQFRPALDLGSSDFGDSLNSFSGSQFNAASNGYSSSDMTNSRPLEASSLAPGPEVPKAPAPPPKMELRKSASPAEAVIKRRSESKARSSSKDRQRVDLFNGFDQAAEPCMDYEKRSVRNLVDRFSKTKPGSLPSQYLPQQYSKNFEPPLNYLKKSDAPPSGKPPLKKKEAAEPEEEKGNPALIPDRPRASVLDFLLMPEDGEERGEGRNELKKGREGGEEGSEIVLGEGEMTSGDILDPSTLLSGEELESLVGRTGSNLAVEDSQLTEEMGKWDNHNTIARGWQSASANYVPVTFRKKYHVSKTPLASSS
eukprot:TRINITY_DN696_c0_g1_i11.p1 TRINITY_DN696_c0_g1~~TRINITY_DN696_c0_g1_i11.p1  ORF type:complete len:1212 (-),score=402.42 TRINITY_DN696_c0_g1_i11:738-4373(-)